MKIENEQGNKAVITSRDIINGKSFISYVYYDEDGDWQFFDGETIKEQDAAVISIQQILTLDTSLRNLPEMEIDTCVTRNSVGDTWQIG
ncbi:hypothetical protein [Myroides sp.]|uniref:hypothetical protein n=1 Tax=Myroides sp. TaxID=1874736 RepID=UPI003F3438EC